MPTSPEIMAFSQTGAKISIRSSTEFALVAGSSILQSPDYETQWQVRSFQQTAGTTASVRCLRLNLIDVSSDSVKGNLYLQLKGLLILVTGDMDIQDGRREPEENISEGQHSIGFRLGGSGECLLQPGTDKELLMFSTNFQQLLPKGHLLPPPSD
ncbi:hypothetical protein CRM22_007336 [Opisthorchis felineus]|uniref:Uncharacterized protein n=1 Tax=Opisthorchis felineus TaxID=147828 RepID=A0A4S2LGC4_OPIFE|nr:hypothetical protein CRM22_007336 [Opisthorchis felineus]